MKKGRFYFLIAWISTCFLIQFSVRSNHVLCSSYYLSIAAPPCTTGKINQVSEIFLRQRICIVFRVAGNEEMAAVGRMSPTGMSCALLWPGVRSMSTARFICAGALLPASITSMDLTAVTWIPNCPESTPTGSLREILRFSGDLMISSMLHVDLKRRIG